MSCFESWRRRRSSRFRRGRSSRPSEKSAARRSANGSISRIATSTRRMLRKSPRVDDGVAPSYADTLKHARNLQRKARHTRDRVAPTIAQLSTVMSEGLPEAIDDMRAYFADRLQAFKERVRGGSTDMWQAFWRTTKPQTENICRNPLVD